MDLCVDGALSRTLKPRLKRHLLSSLLCLGRHTVTGLLCTAGRQQCDWSADYRLFARERIDKDALFAKVQSEILKVLPSAGPLVLALDDTRIRKWGKRTAGVSVMRDPLGLPYHPNLMRGQRFLQISLACPEGEGGARLLPVDFTHAPLAVKPRRSAPPDKWEAYRRQQRELRLGRAGADRLAALRASLDTQPGGAGRRLICSVDGGFTNGTFLKRLPGRCTVIGRIRGDATIFSLPEEQPGRGRRRIYGKRAPTPKELYADADVPWQEITVHFSAAAHKVRVKTLSPVRWRSAGAIALRLVVIAPIRLHSTPQGRWTYREPAYLICTDPDLPLEELVQDYIWRWEIENNFRDEKTVLGIGQAQVRGVNSVECVPAVGVAAYSLLLLAGLKLYGRQGRPLELPPPKWNRRAGRRITTQQLVMLLRYQMWGSNIIYCGFELKERPDAKPQKCNLTLAPALFYGAACA